MRAPASILLALPLVRPVLMSPSRPLAACGVGVQRRWTGAVAQAASAVGKVSLSGDFTSPFPTHPDFENSAEEFHPMKLSLLP
jgi:hypothetical protein